MTETEEELEKKAERWSQKTGIPCVVIDDAIIAFNVPNDDEGKEKKEDN